jgi:acyl-CoA thioester hydrolase
LSVASCGHSRTRCYWQLTTGNWQLFRYYFGMADTPAEPVYDEVATEVRYGESDQMGYAHHSTAVLWFELGRVHWLREHGLSYRELEASGVLLPVVSLQLRYHAPARFEDALVIQTRLLDLGKTRVVFENRVVRPEPNGQRTLLVSGTVDLACVDRAGKLQRVPKEFEKVAGARVGGR